MLLFTRVLSLVFQPLLLGFNGKEITGGVHLISAFLPKLHSMDFLGGKVSRCASRSAKNNRNKFLVINLPCLIKVIKGKYLIFVLFNQRLRKKNTLGSSTTTPTFSIALKNMDWFVYPVL